MASRTSRRSERCALLVAALLAVPALGHAEQAAPDAHTARSDPRAGTQSVGVPYSAIALQAGKDEQRLTGAFAYAVGGFTFDVKLSGANVAKSTQQSLLFDALGSAPGGQLSLGVTWSSFTTRTDVVAQVIKLCAEQNQANGYSADKDEDKAREAALGKDPGYQRARAAKEALEAEQKEIGDLVAARAAAAGAVGAARAAQAEADRLDKIVADLSGQIVTGGGPADGMQRLQVALASARLAASRAAQAQLESMRAEERASRAARLPGELARAAEDFDKEKKRAEKAVPPYCNSRGELSAERRARIQMPFHPTFIVGVRGNAEAKSTDYLDTAAGKKKTDTVYPASASVAAGVYLHPSSLLAVRLDYGRTRKAEDPSDVCQDLPIAGKTTTPATYQCQSLSIGAPTWATKTSIRAEYRQYIARGVGLNPSFTYAWAGPETAPFGAKKGSWAIDVPLYIRIKATDLGAAPPLPKAGDDKAADKKDGAEVSALTFGVALTHRQTWGLADDNQTTDDVSVFLGGSFDLGLH